MKVLNQHWSDYAILTQYFSLVKLSREITPKQELYYKIEAFNNVQLE